MLDHAPTTSIIVPGAIVFLLIATAFLVCALKKKGGPRTRKTVRFKKNKANKSQQNGDLPKPEETSPTTCCAKVFCRGRNKPTGPFPEPPFGLELQDPSETELTIIWNAPATEGQTVKILGYKIYARFKNSPNDWTKVGKVPPEQLEYRMNSLLPLKQYVFGVSSRGKDGDSKIVESQPYMLKKDPVQPGAPAEFDVIDKTSSSMTLSWKPPRKEGYARIHTYYLMMKDCERGGDWTYLTQLPAFDRFMDYRVTGLTPKHSYRFRVNAENSAGLGPYAETVTHETPDVEPEPPQKPKGPIKYARISHNTITLSWQPPEEDGGKPVTGYIVEYKDKDSDKWHRAGVVEADKRKMTVPRLQEDVEFVFRVIAMNEIGNSKPLQGARVKTKLLEIPLSRRSSFRLPSRADTSRGSSGGRTSRPGSYGRNLDLTNSEVNSATLRRRLEELDFGLESHPHVPQSDFFKYDDETSSADNISNRHGENKTRHHQYSPLPAPPNDDSNSKKMSEAEIAVFGANVRHSEYSPLPKPTSRLRHSYPLADTDDATDDDGVDDKTRRGYKSDRLGFSKRGLSKELEHSDTLTTTQSSILGDLPDFSGHRGSTRHQSTPSNVAYTHSR